MDKAIWAISFCLWLAVAAFGMVGFARVTGAVWQYGSPTVDNWENWAIFLAVISAGIGNVAALFKEGKEA